MYSSAPMPRRTLCVFDEAHLLNDLFTEHNAIYVSEKRIAKMVDEVSEALTLGSTNVFRELKAFKDAMVAGRITEDPEIYQHWLKRLLDAYTEISDAAKAAAERNSRSPAKYLKFQKLHKKYYGLGCKIDDLFQFGYPVVFEHKPKDIKKQQHEDEISVKPIFVGEMFAVLDNADHNLLMSATISKQYAERTLVLPEKTVHIRLEPQFPKENKRVVFFKPQALNYNSMKSPDTVKKLTSASRQIVDHHSALGERGIVLAPSFAVVQEIATVLRQKSPKYTVFEHQRGDKLADLLEDFKRWDKGPAVMLTPSGFEGLDLPGDLSRYQIIVKAPFGSLGDKRVKTILDLYPDIYSLTTLMKIVQGAGRSVRSMEDHATTYMLDTGIQRLWTAKNNEWAPEFHTVFTSNLGPVDTE
jgi:Rad3-related DNA helicase